MAAKLSESGREGQGPLHGSPPRAGTTDAPDLVVIAQGKHQYFLSARMIEYLKKYSGNIIVVLDCHPNDIHRVPSISCRLVFNHENSNTGYSTYLGLQYCKTPHILVCEDTLSQEELQVLRTDVAPIVFAGQDNIKRVGMSIIDGKSGAYSWGLPYQWTGAVIMDRRLKESFCGLVENKRYRNWFTWEILEKLGPIETTLLKGGTS